MPGWSWKRRNKSQPLTGLGRTQQAVARGIPLVAGADRLYTTQPQLTSPYGPSYAYGRQAYANPPSVFGMQTMFAVIGQLNMASQVGPWVYSPGLPTATTVFPQVGGNPPEGGFVLDTQIGSL